MGSLIILLMAIILLVILLIIILFVNIKKRYHEKHIVEDYDIDDDLNDDEVEIVYILIDNEKCIFDVNGNYLVDGEYVTIRHNGRNVSGVVIGGNTKISKDNLHIDPEKLEIIESSIDYREELVNDDYNTNNTINDANEIIPKKKEKQDGVK